MFARISRSKLLGKKTSTTPQQSLADTAAPSTTSSAQESVEDARGWTKRPDGAEHRSGIRLDVLGNLYDPDNKRAHKRIVVDAKKRPDTADLIGGRNHWRDLYGDYHVEDHDWVDTIEHAERIIAANLSADNYYENVRRVCFRVDASAGQAAQVARVLELSFSYDTTGRKLRATRLWGIILRYCSSQAFVDKTTQTPFLRPIKTILKDTNSHAGLRTRMMEVIAGARLVYPECKPFRELWRSVKCAEDPDEGIPFRSPLFIVPNIQLETTSGPSATESPPDPPVEPPADMQSLRSLKIRHMVEESREESTGSGFPAAAHVASSHRRISSVTVVSEAGTAPPYSEAMENWPSVVRHPSFAPPGYE